MQALYFSGSWCKPCKAFLPIVEAVCSEKGLDLHTVDVERETDMTNQHYVKAVPTLIIVDEKGFEVYRTSSALPSATLLSVLEDLRI